MDNNIEEIKSRLNIVDVVGEYVRLTKAGVNWKALCPFHNEKGPSFMVNEEKQFYHCFGCNRSGDMFSFVMEMESLEFREALKLLAEKAGVRLEAYQPKPGEKKDRTLEILELATKFYEIQLWKGMGKDKIMDYLHGRGLSDESIHDFRLGYAPPGWRNILNFLIGRGYSAQEIEKSGLLVRKNQESRIKNHDSKFMTPDSEYYDRFRDRIMFPVADSMGKVVGYSARVAPGGDESQAKYINTPESGVYHKSKVLYGLDQAKREIKQKNSVLLVEGNLDVIASAQAGLKNVVAVSGTALTGDQIDTLKRYAGSIRMLFDMDSAGQKAAERSADLCFQKGVEVYMVKLAEGKDAAELAEKDPQALVKAVEAGVPAMEYFFEAALSRNDVKSAEGKKAIAKELLERLANVSNQIERQYWIKKIAQALDVEEKTIAGVLKTVQAPQAFRSDKPTDPADELEAEFQKRSEKIRKMIAGLALSSAANWQKTAELHGGDSHLQGDSLIRYVLSQGERFGYSFDNLLLGVEDENLKRILREAYFEAKYHFDSTQNIVEYSQDEIFSLTEQYIREFVKELQKERLSGIIKDIRNAEQSGNKEALNSLMREFTNLSQELR